MRTIIVGGPSRGKSTLADELHHEHGWPVFCGDPASMVMHQKPYTHYLPEQLDFAGDGGPSPWICKHWFTMPGPWVCEGHCMARALRRWTTCDLAVSKHWKGMFLPCDRIIVLDRPAHRAETPGQAAMHRGVMTTWRSIAPYFMAIAEIRRTH